MRHALVLLVVVSVVNLTTACGDDNDVAGTPGPTDQGGGSHGSGSPVGEHARRVPISAWSFAFDPADMTVKVGEEIAIVLTSEDSLHDVTVDEVDAHVSAGKGETAVGGFRAEQPGRYTFYCSVTGHRDAGMKGVLVVKA